MLAIASALHCIVFVVWWGVGRDISSPSGWHSKKTATFLPFTALDSHNLACLAVLGAQVSVDGTGPSVSVGLYPLDSLDPLDPLDPEMFVRCL